MSRYLKSMWSFEKLFWSLLLAAATALMFTASAALAVVPASPVSTSFTANGTTSTFNFGFKVLSTQHVHVYQDGIEKLGGWVPTVNLQTQDSNPGGSITFKLGESLQPPPAGAVIRIERIVPLSQDSLWTPYSAFKAKTLEGVLDKLVMHDQQIAAKIDDSTAGGMLKSTYDPDDNGAVEHAEFADAVSGIIPLSQLQDDDVIAAGGKALVNGGSGGNPSWSSTVAEATYAANAGGAAYATSAGNATNADTLDGYHASAFLPYEVVAYVPGKPAANATVLRMTFTQAVSFPTNLSGSFVNVGVGSTAAAAYSLTKCPGGSSCSGFGTISISGTTPTIVVTATTFAAGDWLYITAPAVQDSTLADVAFTLKGTR
ncbi:hypothetical protein [Anaeromyxobacter sp. SG66]|uniref:hypothetical protein n=1 Tax=Anaeromyxobacter sp. SG66 TaxID=2925410 RepID=UPI001F5628C4|nr:hypothetical protein [Anaeromyxobacter sp. SG66]